ncbi:transporter [Escherichia coli]|nr:transporter [Escherichia coli]
MSNIWSKEETLWSFALYGTAVGAGTLFLPIQLGSAGAVVLFITALVAWPLTYWPHKALCQFILSSKTSAGEGITGAGFAPIFPDTCYHLTHYWPAAADIPVASDNPVHYAGAIRYNARTPLQGSLLPLTRLV